MTKTRIDCFTDSTGTKHFTREDCQRAELTAIPGTVGIEPADWILKNADAILAILRPARRKAIKPAKAAKKKPAVPTNAPTGLRTVGQPT